jgi:CheY-like chemotaxis protein
MNNATILVVDDEPQLRRAMKATLTDLGYSVIEASIGGKVGVSACALTQ